MRRYEREFRQKAYVQFRLRAKSRAFVMRRRERQLRREWAAEVREAVAA